MHYDRVAFVHMERGFYWSI